MIPAYRRHTVRCVACAVPEVTTSCGRCLVALCDAHAPEVGERCGTCEAEWVFGQVERATWRGEVLQPLLFATLVSAALVAFVIGSWPIVSLGAAVAALLLGVWAPVLEANAQRRSFLGETLEKRR